MAMSKYGLGEKNALVIEALYQVPSKELVILLTQHATLPNLITSSLHTLAIDTIQSGLKGLQKDQQKHANQIANILRRLIARGDPSQARRLVPTHTSLIDLAICTDSKDILARLIDEKGTEDILKAAINAYNTVASTEKEEHIIPSAKILARLLHALPRRKYGSNNSTRRGQASKAPSPTSRDVEKLLDSFQKLFSSIVINVPLRETDESKLHSKVTLMEAAWTLLERQSSIGCISSADVERLLTNATNGTGTTPLNDLPLLVDLALVKPVVTLLRNSSAHSQALDGLEERIKKLKVEESDSQNMIRQSSAWKQVLDMSERDFFEKDSSHSILDPELLSTITAIMPQWAHHLDRLKEKLVKPPYQDQSNDLIIQMLLDEGESEIIDTGRSSLSTNARKEVDPMELLRQRANVFDDQPLESSNLHYGGRKGKGRNMDITLGSGLSQEMKAAIVARAEAPDSDEEDREEWDPFAERNEIPTLEVGFEEEFDEDGEGDRYADNLFVRKPAADEDRSEDEEEDIEEAEIDGHHGGAGHGTIHSNNGKTNIESERAAERIMITAWKENGSNLFDKQQRGSVGRKQLIARLNDISTSNKRWDDQLIESWATMFNRNPRKEKLLANVDDLMRIGNPNRAPISSEQDLGEGAFENRSRFGPDRGRGGRILAGGGGQHSRGSVGGGRGRGGGSGRGRGRGGGNRGHRGKPSGGRN